jgi:hypothetical protein
MAREAGFEAMRGHGLLPHVPEDIFIANVRVTEEVKHLVALVRADERRSKPHSLGPGEMELSLRREHNGELFEYRHRFSAEQVMHGPIFMVTDAAKRMDDEIDAAINARGST